MTTAGSAADVPTQSIHYMWPIHGVLMSIAFGFFIPVGIVCARFFRSPRHSPAWFRLHQVCMFVAFALVIAGFGIGVYHAHDDDFSHSEFTFHRRAGFYVFTAICLQVFLGFVRPHTSPPGSGQKITVQRSLWNEMHRWNGRVAYVFGVALIYTGVHVLDRQTTLWYVLFSALWGSVMLVALLLQLVVCVRGSAFGDDGTCTRTTLTGSTTAILKEQPAQLRAVAAQTQDVITVSDKADTLVAVEKPQVLSHVPIVQDSSITQLVENTSQPAVQYKAAAGAETLPPVLDATPSTAVTPTESLVVEIR